MKNLTIVALISGLVIVPIHAQSNTSTKPVYDPYQQYEHEFDSQVEVVNVIMEVYSNTDCTDKSFHAVASKYVNEYNKLIEIFKRRPEKEPKLVRLRQNEIFTGLTEISNRLDDEQNSCIQEAFPHQGVPVPHQVQPTNNSST